MLGIAASLGGVLAGCGGGSSTVTVSGQASRGGALSATYRGPHYALAVPAWRPFVTRSSTGRVNTGWSTPGTGNFAILVTDDPHPQVSLDSAANTSAQSSRKAYQVSKQSVVSAHVAGARAAKLITDSGPHGVGPYHASAQNDANLIVTTPSGAMINVLVVSHGAGNPDPMSVIDSFRLVG